jgi:hypothetical protein
MLPVQATDNAASRVQLESMKFSGQGESMRSWDVEIEEYPEPTPLRIRNLLQRAEGIVAEKWIEIAGRASQHIPHCFANQRVIFDNQDRLHFRSNPPEATRAMHRCAGLREPHVISPATFIT